MTRIAILDYGVGNLHSLQKAIEAGGGTAHVTSDVASAVDADALVLPGVGAFGAASAQLGAQRATLRSALAQGLPCLGICLGMQLLFDASDEGAGAGLGIIPGQVRRLRARSTPQMGWNTVTADATRDPLFAVQPNFYAYYANSYVCAPSDPADVTAWSTYGGERFPAAVRRGNVRGVQFHPEKSGADGIAMLRSFVAEAGA